MIFLDKKIFFQFECNMYSDRFEIDLSDEASEIKILISMESYDEETAKNDRNCYVAEKCIVSKLLKISIPNFYSTYWKLK